MDLYNTMLFQIDDLFAKNGYQDNPHFKNAFRLSCELTGVPMEMILSDSKKEYLVYARELMYYILQSGYGYSVNIISEFLDVERKSIYNGLNNIKSSKKQKIYVALDIATIDKTLKLA